MMREVIEDAIKNTGIDYSEITKLNKLNKIAVFVGNFDGEQYINQGHLSAFLTEVNPAFYGVPSARYEAACASGSVAIDAASAKIRAGDYDLCIVLGIEVMKTVNSAVGGDFLGTAAYYEKKPKELVFLFLNFLVNWQMSIWKSTGLMKKDISIVSRRSLPIITPMPNSTPWPKPAAGL